MDPNATLAQIREALTTYRANLYSKAGREALQDLAELVEALDGWLSGGGFLPNEWDF